MLVTDIDISDDRGFHRAEARPERLGEVPRQADRGSIAAHRPRGAHAHLDRAVRVHSVLTANPARGVVRFSRPEDDDRVDPFTPDELRTILDTPPPRTPSSQTLVRFWAQSGVRLGEVSGVQNHDLDMAKARSTFGALQSGRSDLANLSPGPTKTRQTRVVSFLQPDHRDDVRVASRRHRRVAAASSTFEATATRRLGPRRTSSRRQAVAAWRVWEVARALGRGGAALTATRSSCGTRSPRRCSRANRPAAVRAEGGRLEERGVLLRVYSRWNEEAMPAAPDLPSFHERRALSGSPKAPDACRRKPGASGTRCPRRGDQPKCVIFRGKLRERRRYDEQVSLSQK